MTLHFFFRSLNELFTTKRESYTGCTPLGNLAHRASAVVHVQFTLCAKTDISLRRIKDGLSAALVYTDNFLTLTPRTHARMHTDTISKL